MSKSIWNSNVLHEILERAEKLHPGSHAHWGSMNVTEMMAHINLANQSILNAPPASSGPTLKQRLGKFYFFVWKNDFPKLAKGAKRFDMKGKVEESAFNDEKSKMIKILNKFEGHKEKVNGMHPVFGPLNHEEWGVFVAKHMDHHLRQFGV